MRIAYRLFPALVAVGLIGTVATSSPALCEKRVALVIGNNTYRNVSQLNNPTNDAGDMAASLGRLGFSVRQVSDGTYDDMRRALLEFNRAARNSDMALLFFAGHGIEVGGENYLIPIDAELKTDIDVDHEAIGLRAIMGSVATASQLGMVILDACRNNPFAAKMQRTVRSRSVSRGLAAVEPTGNVLIAFAAKEGTTAADGLGRNSPFTTALLKHLETPGLEISFLFRHVRDDVIRATRREQQPFVYGSLSKDAVYFKDPAPTPSIDPEISIRRDYEFAAQIGTKDAWDLFLQANPKGFYAELARAARAKILAAEKAEADAAAARVRAEAAEKTKAANAEAERVRAEAAKVAAEQAERERAQAAERARVEAERVQAEAAKTKLAALPPDSGPDAVQTTRALQSELRRVGCHSGAIDGNWNAASRQALEKFNLHSGTKLDAKTASLDALDSVKAKPSRVCPIVCERGQRPEGEQCVAIVCPAGEVLGRDGNCRKSPQRTTARPEAKTGGAKEQAKPAGGSTPRSIGAIAAKCRAEIGIAQGSGGASNPHMAAIGNLMQSCIAKYR